MKKNLSKVILGFCLFLAIFLVGRNVILKAGLEQGVHAVTGLPLRIKSLEVCLLKTCVHIQGLRLENPPAFEDRMMMDIPEIYVDYDLGKILKGQVFLNEIRLHLNEFIVVRNAEGNVNLAALKALKKRDDRSASPGSGQRKADRGLDIKILELKIGRVVYKDYSQGQGDPLVRIYPIRINERYENIPNMKALVRLMVFKALTNTTIASLTNIDLQGLKAAVEGTLKSAKTLAVGTVKTTADLIKKTTDEITDVITKPLGNKETP